MADIPGDGSQKKTTPTPLESNGGASTETQVEQKSFLDIVEEVTKDETVTPPAAETKPAAETTEKKPEAETPPGSTTPEPKSFLDIVEEEKKKEKATETPPAATPPATEKPVTETPPTTATPPAKETPATPQATTPPATEQPATEPETPFGDPEAPPITVPPEKAPVKEKTNEGETKPEAAIEVVEPALRARIDDLTTKLVTHVENGANFLASGKGAEATEAYKNAAELISVDDQKLFFAKEKEIQKLIDAENLKAESDRDMRKLEDWKQLQLNLHTLSHAPMFTMVNSGLVFTQMGQLDEAGKAFAKGYMNEKVMQDAGMVPKEGYLSQERNLAARINEIGKKQNVDLWANIKAAVQGAGGDLRLVSAEPERGPPPREVAVNDPTVKPQDPGTVKLDDPTVTPDGTPRPDQTTLNPPTEAEKPKDGNPPNPTPDAAPKEKVEPLIDKVAAIAPNDTHGRTPLEQIGLLLEQAKAKEKTFDAVKPDIEKAIADADKGVSEKLGQLRKQNIESFEKFQTGLHATVPGSQETVALAIGRLDLAALGKAETQVDPATRQARLVQVKDGIIDKLVPPPPEKYKPEGLDELKPPKDYKGTAEQYREEIRVAHYRREVKTKYAELDEALTEQQYQDVLKRLKDFLPEASELHPEPKQLLDILNERDKVTKDIRTPLFTFNSTEARIPAEENHSAVARTMLAEALMEVGDEEGAKRWITEAYAVNQAANQTAELRAMALAAGCDPVTLIEAAINQNLKRGGGKNGKCMEVEHLLEEANSMYFETPDKDKKAFVDRLKKPFDDIQNMSNTEYKELLARSASLRVAYESALPPDNKQKILDCEKRLAEAEAKFSPADRKNASDSMNPELSQDERDKAKAALMGSQKDWAKDSDLWKQLAGDKVDGLIELKGKMILHIGNVNQAVENLFYSRAVQANMMLETGDVAGAKTKLTEGFGAVPGGVRDMLLQRESLKGLAKAVGLEEKDIKALPQPDYKAATAPGGTPAPGNPPTGQPDKTTAGPPEKTPTGQPGNPPATQPEKPPTGQPEKAPTGDRPAAEAEPPKEDDPLAKLNPIFKHMGIEDLENEINAKAGAKDTVDEVKALYEELIKRYDIFLDPKDFDATANSMRMLLDALKLNKDVTVKDGKRIIMDGKDGRPNLDLTADRRWELHLAVFGDLDTMNTQSKVRLEYATFLKSARQYEDAQKWATEARDYAERILKPYQIDGKTVRVLDMIREYDSALQLDQETTNDATQRAEMKHAHNTLMGINSDTGLIKTPIKANKFLAQFYLGTEVVPNLGPNNEWLGIKEIKFGQNRAFKPALAWEATKRAHGQIKDIMGFDPMNPDEPKSDDTITSLYGTMKNMIINEPEKYDLFRDTNGDKKPDLISMFEYDNIVREIKKDSTLDSLVLDVGLTIGVVAANNKFSKFMLKNETVVANFEKAFGKYAPLANGTIRAIGGLGIVGTGIMARHHGYKWSTGVSESWTDSGLHIVGSLCAAEAGGLVSGRGGMLFSGKLGPRQFARMDAEGAAQYLNKEGYDTVGKVVDLLKGQNAELFVKEAESFAHLDRGLKLIDPHTLKANPQILEAITRADMRFARMGTVSEVLSADLAKASGVKTLEFTQYLAKLETGSIKTVDDLFKLMANDQKVIKEAATRVQSAAEGTLVKDALKDIAGTQEGMVMIETAEKFGCTKVEQLRALHVTAEKLGPSRMFPRLAELEAAGAINRSTTLVEAANLGAHVLDGGPGLRRLLSAVPIEERAAFFTEKGLKKTMSMTALGTDKSLIAQAQDALAATKRGVKATTRTLFTKEGHQAIKDTLSPLGTSKFWKSTPSAAWNGVYNGGAWGLTKLNSARHHVTDRLSLAKLDPLTATPEALSRARWGSGLYTSIATVGTYNTIVKPYDMTGEVFGVKLDSDHLVELNEDGNPYTYWGAVSEAHYPSLGKVNPAEMPWYGKYLVPVARSVAGTPGQALFGAVFVRPGAIYRPVLSDPTKNIVTKGWQSVSPFSRTRWNNLQAGLLKNSGSSASLGALAPGALFDSVGPRLGRGEFDLMLENYNLQIANEEREKQKTTVEKVKEYLTGAKPEPGKGVPDAGKTEGGNKKVKPTGGDGGGQPEGDGKVDDGKLKEPPPPGSE